MRRLVAARSASTNARSSAGGNVSAPGSGKENAPTLSSKKGLPEPSCASGSGRKGDFRGSL